MSALQENNKLKLDFIGIEAATLAVKRWHYSKCMPAGKTVKIGVWEDEKFIGAVIFGRGANFNMPKFFKLKQDQICELCRVALTNHTTPVTRIVKIALKLLKKICPKLRLVFSYADESGQGHKGIIYKAGGWHYLGTSKGCVKYNVNGKWLHGRTVRSRYGSVKNIKVPWFYGPEEVKHLFVILFDKDYCLNNVRAAYQPLSRLKVAMQFRP